MLAVHTALFPLWPETSICQYLKSEPSMEKVVLMSWNTQVLFNGIALFMLGLFPCSINFSYTLPYPSALFHSQIILWNECYLPNLEDYFETLQDVFRCPNDLSVRSNYSCSPA